MIAFWKYDLFPFCLGGKVAKEREDGCVYIESYRSWFKPVAVFLDEEGLALLDKINALEQLRNRELREFNEKYDEELNSIAPFLSKGING